ncbi:MAG TPA: serine/threonine-protein kinase [Polyangia bacterium]|jgi:serine/threonine-protein kinase|nr:serine/threonine-protein kinase [Polyangia bacterium]
MEEPSAIDSEPSHTLAIGEVVATKYRIEGLLGSGGMAEIYAAVNVLTDRQVALKWILPALATSKEAMARFRREALAAGRINHPNVVAIFDVVEHQASACIVMELLHGETLATRLKRTGPLPVAEAVAILLPAMRGVAAAHARGVIHRDLKPDNLFLCLGEGGSIRDCKVLDFGVSKLAVADAATTGDITLSGDVVGTPEYMAPEQVRSGKNVDRRLDVYSLGVVFYETLAGRPPFVGEHFSGLMLDIMQREPPSLTSLRPEVPKQLAGVIHRALEKDVDRRFQDMPAFIEAVEAAAHEELQQPTPNTSQPPSRSSQRLRLTRSAGFAVGAFVVLLMALGVRLTQTKRPAPPAIAPTAAVEPPPATAPVTAPPPTSPAPSGGEAAAPDLAAAPAAASLVRHIPGHGARAPDDAASRQPGKLGRARPLRAGKLTVDDF